MKKTVAIFSQCKIDRLIPKEGLELFPLKHESLNDWDVSNLDVVQFLKYLLNKEAECISSNGKKRKVNYQFYWKDIFYRNFEQLEIFAKEFEEQAKRHKPVPGSIVKTVKVPDFFNDKYFGSIGKYYIIYDGIIDQMLSESYFFTISHLLESKDELNCSILLAGRLYYKQSLQVLRNFIELLVSQILFCYDSKAFDDWRNARFKIPSLRGKDGLLKKLVNKDLISSTLSDKVSKLYGDLNECIHSAEGRLIHRGSFTGDYIGFIFDYDYFKTWSAFFSDVVESGIWLLDSHSKQISKFMKQGIMCSVCHNGKEFNVKEFEFVGQTYLKLICKKCNNEMTIKK